MGWAQLPTPPAGATGQCFLAAAVTRAPICQLPAGSGAVCGVLLDSWMRAV